MAKEKGFFSGPRPRVFAHRGASGTFPENTMQAYSAAVEGGATHLELDVHATRDGTLVAIHDHSIDRVSDAQGEISEMLLAELRAVDVGYGFVDADGNRPYAGKGFRIPTLAEVLESFEAMPMNIEIKQEAPAIEEMAVALIEKCESASRILLAAEKQTIMDRIRRCYAGPTGFSADEALDFYLRSTNATWEAYRPPGRALQIPLTYSGIELLTPTLVDDAHRMGIEVHVWTINDAATMLRMLRMGVDGVMSDFPALAAEVIGAT